MTRVRETAAVTVTGTPGRLHVRSRRPRRAAITGTTAVVRIDPRVLATALELAGDDPARITLWPDGSVTVHNHRRGDHR